MHEGEVHCRRVLIMLQRGVPQALLGGLQALECDGCGQGAPLPISQQQLMVVVGVCSNRNESSHRTVELLK
ncbi:MAG: hypothetical protein ACKPKO_26360, partial [Candidatus Fonsibacter sp.]